MDADFQRLCESLTSTPAMKKIRKTVVEVSALNTRLLAYVDNLDRQGNATDKEATQTLQAKEELEAEVAPVPGAIVPVNAVTVTASSSGENPEASDPTERGNDITITTADMPPAMSPPVAPDGMAADADTKEVPPVPQQSLGGENPEASTPAEKGSDVTVPTGMPAPAVGVTLECLEVAPVPAGTAADADTKDVPPVPQQSLGGENADTKDVPPVPQQSLGGENADTKDAKDVPPVPQQSLGGENPEASTPAEKGSDATVPTDMPGATAAPAVGMPLEAAGTPADADTKDVPSVPPVPHQNLGGENPEFAVHAPPAVTVSSELSAVKTGNAAIAAAVEKPVDEQIDTVAVEVEAAPLQAVKPEVEEIDENQDAAVGVHQTFAALAAFDPSVVIAIVSDSESEAEEEAADSADVTSPVPHGHGHGP